MSQISVFDELKKFAEENKNDKHQIVGSMAIGDTCWQGDLGIVYIGDKEPVGLSHVAYVRGEQLVPGNTQGARHTLDVGCDGVVMYAPKTKGPCDGNIIWAPNGLRVNHPEHKDFTFEPGCYHVIYQRAYAEELRRQLD